MNFFTIILRGLLRRPIRTGLTLAGISIGIAAVVAPMVVGGSAGQSLEFALGGVGFAVGIVAAIWLARRFEEAEEKIQKQRGGPRPS